VLITAFAVAFANRKIWNTNKTAQSEGATVYAVLRVAV